MQMNVHVNHLTLVETVAMYTSWHANFADSAIDRGHSYRRGLSFGHSFSLPRIQVRDDRVECTLSHAAFLSDQLSIAQGDDSTLCCELTIVHKYFVFSLY